MDSITNSVNCAKCFSCFDTFDHYHETLELLKPDESKRYYCIAEHSYVKPTDEKGCFKPL